MKYISKNKKSKLKINPKTIAHTKQRHLITYPDILTLLSAFLLILFLMSKI